MTARLAARVIAEAAGAPDWVVVGYGGPPPAGRLAALLGGEHAIGAVLPAATGPCRDTPALSAPAAAVRAALVASAGLDPDDDDPSGVVAALLRHVRALGLRVVAEPEWAAPAGFDPPAAEGINRILLVADVISSSVVRPGPRAVWDLAVSLAATAADTEVTVASAERIRRAEDARLLRSLGVRLFDGPADWESLGARLGRQPSHVVVTSAAAGRTSALDWTAAQLPAAQRILFVTDVPFEEVTALRPMDPPDEGGSFEHVRAEALDRLGPLLEWADLIWYQWPRHAALASLAGVARPAFHVPPAVEPHPQTGASGGARSGMVLVAEPGADVAGAHEDAALRVLTTIVPYIRSRDGSVPVRVVSDSPTPMLEDAARAAGADIVPVAGLAGALSSSRVFVAGHLFGTGQPGLVLAALASGAGVVATPHGAGGADLGSLSPSALRGPDADMAVRVWQLLSDDRYFDRYRRAAGDLLRGSYSPASRAARLRDALAVAGIDSEPGSGQHAAKRRWPADGSPGELPPRWRPPRVQLRPGGMPVAASVESPEPAGERERYELWAERYGPTPAVQAAIRGDLARLRRRPSISVLVPVHDTPPELLLEAVDSVRAQIYDRWELCIGNDASSRPETLAVLDALRSDGRVKVVDLQSAGGISAATNAALGVAAGEYVAFLDHDDVLKPHALAQVARWLDADPSIDVVYTDEDKLDAEGRLYDPHLKPDWSPDQLTAQNYVCHLTVARRDLVASLGGLRSDFDGSQDHDLILRLAEATDRIAHIPEPLYSWRALPGSAAAEVDAKPYAIAAGRRAVADALARRGWAGKVDESRLPNHYRPRYEIPGRPRVAVIVPTRDGGEKLERCVDSVLERSTYDNFDLVVVDNDSRDASTLAYLALLPARVIRYPHRFNYARQMNLAARSVACDVYLFLNDDTEVITPGWIEALLEHAMRPEVGAVGARLFYRDGRPQHEGVMVGALEGYAYNVDYGGFWGRGEVVRNASAVTGACTMVRAAVYWSVGGNDERLRVAYNDVDLCLRIRQAGYEVVYTPAAELYHFEGYSRKGKEHPEDGPLFGERWHPQEKGDPYYSPILSKLTPFRIRI